MSPWKRQNSADPAGAVERVGLTESARSESARSESADRGTFVERFRAGGSGGQLTLVGLSASAALMIVAAWFYPGGTWAEPARMGHLFLENFWCDLLRADALNGRPNPVASELMLLALVTFAGTLAVYFRFMATLLAPDRTSRWVLASGWPAAVGVGIVALSPSDRFPMLHAAAVVAVGPALLAAVLIASVGLWRRGLGPRWAPWLVACGVLLALVNLVQYARQVYWGVEYARWLPGVQKAASLCFVFWMGLVSGSRVRGPGAALRAGPTEDDGRDHVLNRRDVDEERHMRT